MNDPLVGLALIVAFGVGAQWLAWRFRLPSILVLLLAGLAAGPATGLLRPDVPPGEPASVRAAAGGVSEGGG